VTKLSALRLWSRWALAVWLGFVTWVLLAADVAQWWGETETQPPASTARPSVVQDALSWRPDTNEGDTHAVLWAVAAVLCCYAFRSWRARFVGLGMLWVYGCLIEVLQGTTGRQGQWTDVLGNTLGVAAGALVAAAGLRRVRRDRTPATRLS